MALSYCVVFLVIFQVAVAASINATEEHEEFTNFNSTSETTDLDNTTLTFDNSTESNGTTLAEPLIEDLADQNSTSTDVEIETQSWEPQPETTVTVVTETVKPTTKPSSTAVVFSPPALLNVLAVLSITCLLTSSHYGLL